MLVELHSGHPGISKMKNLARYYVWWPKMDSALENQVKQCAVCQNSRKMPPSDPLHPWEWPDKLLSGLQFDYTRPFMGHMLLVIIDAYSKWLEVYSSTSTVTIQKLRDVFSRFGPPKLIITDNATCFTSDEFKQFFKANGIRHAQSAPYHPATNGLAKRAVQTIKDGLKKAREGSLQTKLSRFLFQYRLYPHATMGVSPLELLIGWYCILSWTLFYTAPGHV